MASAADARAGGAFVELYAKDTTKKVLDSLEARLKKFGATVGLIGAAMTAAGAVMMAPFLHGLNIAAEWANEVVAANRRTGVSFEALSSLSYALRTDMDGLSVAVRTMDGLLEQAINNPAGEAAERIDSLGLSIDALAAMTQDERLRSFAGALGNIQDPGQRIAQARHVFGRQGAALDVSGGAAGIAQREQHGRDIGAVMTAENLGIIYRYNTAMREMGIATRAVWAEIGTLIAPFMTGLVTQITAIIQGVRGWIDRHRALVAVVFYLGTALLAIGSIITFIGSVIWIAGGAFTAFSGAIGFVWHAVTSLGGALALLQYGTMIAGLSSVSLAFFGARVALYSYKAAMFLAHAATYAYAFSLGFLQGAWLAAQGVAVSFIATTAAGRGGMIGYAAASYAVAAATWVYNAAVWALTTGFGALTVIQGIAAIGAASWAWLVGSSAIREMAWAAATWVYNAALTALGAIYTFVTATVWSYTASEIAAWIWETILTAGTNLLAFAFSFLFGVLVIATGGLLALAGVAAVAVGALYGVAVAVSLLGFRFASLHESLGFIDEAADGLIEFVHSIGRAIADLWDYLVVSPFMAFVNGIVSAFEWMRDQVTGAAQTIDRIIDEFNAAFDEGGIGDFLSEIAYVAIGIVALAAGLAFLAYKFITIENLMAGLTAIWDFIFSGGLVEKIRQFAADVETIFNQVVAGVQSELADLFGILSAPFIEAYNWILDTWDSIVDFFAGVWAGIVAGVRNVLAQIAAPFVEAFDAIVGWFGDLFAGIAAAARAVGAWIAAPFIAAYERILGAWADLKTWFADLWAGVVATFHEVIDAHIALWNEFVATLEEHFAFVVDALADGWHVMLSHAMFVIDAIRNAFGGLWQQLAALGRAVVNPLIEMFFRAAGAVRDALGGVWASFSAGFSSTVSSVVSAASSAASEIGSTFGRAFSDMRTNAGVAWGGIVAAFHLGDWASIWQVVKLTAELGWLYIKQGGREIWVELKYAALAIFADIKNYLTDLFDGTWLAIQQGWNTVVGEFEAGWLTAVETVKSALFGMLRDVIDEWIGFQRAVDPSGLSVRALEALRATVTDADTGNPEEAGNAARHRAALRNQEMERTNPEFQARQRAEERARLEQARDAEREAVRGGNAEEIENARFALWNLTRDLQEAEGNAAGQQGAGGFDQTHNQGSVSGTFSAALARGFIGANIPQMQLDVNRLQLQRLGEIARVNDGVGEVNENLGRIADLILRLVNREGPVMS